MTTETLYQVPTCCGKLMYDNQASKRNPRAPDFKCKQDGEHVVWVPKGGKMGTDKRPAGSPALPWDGGNGATPPQAAPRASGVPTAPVSIGHVPGLDEQDAHEAAFVRQTLAADPSTVPPLLVQRYRACVREAVRIAAEDLVPHGAPLDGGTVPSIAATLYIQWSRAA